MRSESKSPFETLTVAPAVKSEYSFSRTVLRTHASADVAGETSVSNAASFGLRVVCLVSPCHGNGTKYDWRKKKEATFHLMNIALSEPISICSPRTWPILAFHFRLRPLRAQAGAFLLVKWRQSAITERMILFLLLRDQRLFR